MNYEQLLARIRETLVESDHTAAEISRLATGQKDAIKRMFAGHIPSAKRLIDICSVLELELHVNSQRQITTGKKFNETEFHSKNPALAGHYQVVSALNLSADASVDEILTAIEVLLDSRVNDTRWAALEADMAALHEAIRHLTPPDDNQISEPSAPYVVPEQQTETADATPTRPVSVMELAAAAGGGALSLDERIVGQIWFRRDWLDSKGIDSTQCNIISVKGESMEPTLPDGCSILVDRSRRRRQNAHIFVLLTADGLVVKRLGKDTDRHWQLVSDHPDWESIDWKPDTTVIGEVMWVARSL